MKLKDWLKEKRLDEGKSQQEFSEDIGLSTTTINKLEHGMKPGINILKVLSSRFNIDIKTLRKMVDYVEDNE